MGDEVGGVGEVGGGGEVDGVGEVGGAGGTRPLAAAVPGLGGLLEPLPIAAMRVYIL